VILIPFSQWKWEQVQPPRPAGEVIRKGHESDDTVIACLPAEWLSILFGQACERLFPPMAQ